MDRRDLLKRGAVVGGALVWTAPLVQTITSPALATTSPIEGCPADLFFKHNREDRGRTLPPDQFERSETNCPPTGYETADKQSPPPAGLSVTYSADQRTVYVQVPAGYTITSYDIKAGTDCVLGTLFGTVPGPDGSTVYEYRVPAGSRGISNISFVISCP